MSGIKLAVVALAGLAVTAWTALLTGANYQPETAGLAALGRALTVAIPIAIGLYLWHRRPENRYGPLLTAVGFLWSATSLAESGNPALYSTGRVLAWVFEAALVYLMLAVPAGRLPAGVDRKLAGAVALVVAVLFLPTALMVESYPEPSPYGGCDTDCPGNAFMLLGSEPAFIDSVLRPLREVLSALLVATVALRLAQRVRNSSPPTRRTLAPVLLVAALRCATMVVAFPVRAVVGATSPVLDMVFWIFVAALPLIAIAYLVGDIQSRLFVADALGRLGNRIGAAPSAGTLRSALADTLGDPTLDVAYWGNARGGWVNSEGLPLEPPRNGTGRHLTEIRHDGARTGALIHDGSLREERELVAAVGAYALVAFENHRLIERVEASANEVRESRARIIAAADRERRRIERDLHDGAQQRLVALRIQLELMSETLEDDPAGARRRLHTLGDEVETTLDSIRSLAHDVYPPLLERRGLEGALRAAMADTPIRATVVPDGTGRYPPEVESAVYFCCLEAMQNASKHAVGATRVTISLAGGERLAFEVRDDGCGFDTGATADGTGLTNMRDRLAAVGGEVKVKSALGTGTVVAGSVPVPARE